MAQHAFSPVRGASMAYVWATDDAGEIVSRFFFPKTGSIAEDPATGSACANLGGWFVANGEALLSSAYHQCCQHAVVTVLVPMGNFFRFGF